MRTRLALLTLAFLVATMVRSQTTTDFQSLARLFEYDTKLPLDVQDKTIVGTERRRCHTTRLTSATATAPNGDRSLLP